MFEYNNESEIYFAEINGYEVEINKEFMNAVAVQMAISVTTAYEEKFNSIVRFCAENNNFRCAYPHSDIMEITKKLNKPCFEVSSEGGTISYCEHELDSDHIIDIGFSGVLEEFNCLAING